MGVTTVKAEARRLLQELTQFAQAPAALERLFGGLDVAVLAQLLRWQSAPGDANLRDVLADYASQDDAEAGESGSTTLKTDVVRADMLLLAMGKPALLFAASIYDEELATLVWNGLVRFHARFPTLDLSRQVLDNTADSHGYCALHYAIEAQMEGFLRIVCADLSGDEVAAERAAKLAPRVRTQDVALPVNSAQILGKDIASGGCSLLHLAARKGELELARTLVAAPLSMDAKTLTDWDGNTAYQVALIHGHTDVAIFLQSVTGEEELETSAVAELRLQREECARKRYLASLEPQNPSFLEPETFPQVWSLEESALVRQEVNRVAGEQGWCKQRHAAYPTTDLPCYRVAALDAWVRASLRTRLFPLIAKRYNLPETHTLVFRDLFYVKYEAREGERAELALHRDGSVLSFNVLLNPASDFSGGGTFFEATKRTVHITQGDAAVHSGKVRHAGAPVLSGKRQILVGFLDLVESVF